MVLIVRFNVAYKQVNCIAAYISRKHLSDKSGFALTLIILIFFIFTAGGLQDCPYPAVERYLCKKLGG